MNGRPQKFLNIKYNFKVADLIPEDGTGIRFKELKAKCKEYDISHRILLKELKRLEEAGTITKEAVKADRGAGTCYRRTTGAIIAFSKTVEEAVKKIMSSSEEQQELVAAMYLHSNLCMIVELIYDELLVHAKDNDKKHAKRRLGSSLRDFILPMIIDHITHLSDLPAASNKYAEAAFKEAINKDIGWDQIGKRIVAEKQHDAKIEMEKAARFDKAIECLKSPAGRKEIVDKLVSSGKTAEEADKMINLFLESVASD